MVAVGFAVCATFGMTGTAASVLDIKTLSTHADRVSGGDVLVQITLDQSQAVAVTLNGNDVSSAFHPGATANTLVGLVTGLNLGRNTLAAEDKSLVIIDYSIKGPIVSGPYIQPFICTTQTFQLPDGTTFGPDRCRLLGADEDQLPLPAHWRQRVDTAAEHVEPSRECRNDDNAYWFDGSLRRAPGDDAISVTRLAIVSSAPSQPTRRRCRRLILSRNARDIASHAGIAKGSSKGSSVQIRIDALGGSAAMSRATRRRRRSSRPVSIIFSAPQTAYPRPGARAWRWWLTGERRG